MGRHREAGGLADLIRGTEETVAQLLTTLEQQLVGRDATRTWGILYSGRRCRITDVMIDCEGVKIQAPPYRLAGEGDELLWDENEARCYLRPTCLLISED